jgi:hypothetical protein
MYPMIYSQRWNTQYNCLRNFRSQLIKHTLGVILASDAAINQADAQYPYQQYLLKHVSCKYMIQPLRHNLHGLIVFFNSARSSTTKPQHMQIHPRIKPRSLNAEGFRKSGELTRQERTEEVAEASSWFGWGSCVTGPNSPRRTWMRASRSDPTTMESSSVGSADEGGEDSNLVAGRGTGGDLHFPYEGRPRESTATHPASGTTWSSPAYRSSAGLHIQPLGEEPGSGATAGEGRIRERPAAPAS